MATFTGTGSADRITPASVSAGVTPTGVRPGEDADALYGYAGNDTLDGGGGADYLAGGADNDKLYGGTENDSLYGESGADDLTGGEGDDYLAGGSENDIYRFDAASGVDTVAEAANAGTDQLILAAGLTASKVKIYVENDDLRITFGASQITVLDQFASGVGANARVETLRYGDGATLSLTTPLAAWLTRTGTSANEAMTGSIFADTLNGAGGRDTLNGGDAADRLTGGAGDDYLTGAAGADILDGGTENDTLYAGADNDKLTGGSGNDYLRGEAGNDSYYFGPGFGVDTLSEDVAAGVDTIYFSSGVDKADVKIWVDGDDLIMADGADSVRIVDQFYSGVGSDARVETLQHSDGSRVSLKSVLPAWITRDGAAGNDSFGGSIFNDTLRGAAGADTLSGGVGGDSLSGGTGADYLYGGVGNDNLDGGDEDDALYGEAGVDLLTGGQGDDYLAGGVDNDTYAFAPGFGHDTIAESGGAGTDSIRLSADIAPSEVRIHVINDDLVIDIGDSQVVVQDQYAGGVGSAARVERVTFQDGSPTLSLTSPNAAWLVQTGTGSGETITGSIFGDTLNGGGGADYITAGGDDDSLNGGTGADNLFGGEGADTLNGGAGSDALYGQAGQDVFRFDVAPGPGGIDYIGDFASGDKISLENAVFTGITAASTMSAGFFRLGAAAADSNDRIIFDSASRSLFFDPDGNGAQAQVQFATVAGSVALANTDFIVT